MSSLDRKKLYKSLDDLEGSPSYKKFEHREFQEGTTVLDAPVSRRSFLKLMGLLLGLLLHYTIYLPIFYSHKGS